MMMKNIKKILGDVDIYIIDQFMKGNFLESDKILDAGCGSGRNFKFLHNLGFQIEACDINTDSIETIKKEFPTIRLEVAKLTNLPYSKNEFDYIICNAVLHFAVSEKHFIDMTKELHRVLKPKGILFIRMTSIFGIEKLVKKKGEKYLLPDGSQRFLLTDKLLNFIETKFSLKEVIKTVNVNNLRCMSTLILQKQ